MGYGADQSPAQIAFGTAWYPEQWPETRWETDLSLMQKAHFNTVRIAEFSWSKIQPEEDRFDFEWLDRAIAAAHRHGIRVVIGTPTAAPPIWMTQRYPDILRVDEDGRRAEHGGRRHFSFASGRYRQFAGNIAGELARRYGHNPDVVGWQIDNEVGPPSFDGESIALWHRFLEHRYHTIDALNSRWATSYWSQTYQRFDQVPLHATGPQNPGLLMDFRHFATDTWTSYVMTQANAIRRFSDPRQFITTNTMFWNDGFDHFVMHQNLDIAAWDNYIQEAQPDWIANGANHDLVHGFKQSNFWLMETQAGRVDWVPINRALRPGQVREMGWQAVQHGADAILYWELRPAPNGQESNYGALLMPDGTPAPIFPEIAALGAELARVSDMLIGTEPVAEVGFLYSYDSRWALDLQRLHKDFDPVRQFTDFYRPFRITAQGAAVIPTLASLDRYRLVVAPSLNVLTPEQARHLSDYVVRGGHLILGPRTGQRDESNALLQSLQPGPLRELLGGHVEQFYVLDGTAHLEGELGAGEARIWAETIMPDTADCIVLERYVDPGGWLDGKAAVVTRRVGKGSITYVGAWITGDPMAALTTKMLERAGIKPLISTKSPEVEIGVRAGLGKRILIAINHGDTPQAVSVPKQSTLIAGALSDDVLAPHGVAVLRLVP